MAFSKRFAAAIRSLALALTLVAPQALAQDSTQGPSSQDPQRYLIDLNAGVSFEVAPHTGLMGSSGTFGLKLLMNYSAFTLELAAEQVIGRTANLYPISVNALLNLSTRGRLIPYGAVGGGLLLTVPTNTIGDKTVSTLGVNFGGGARYYITRTFGLRVEGKQYMTSVANERESKNELLFFQEISVGVTFMLH